MRKLIVKLFALSMCIALCFSLVGCTEFSGNYSVKASSKLIDTTFEKLEDTDIAVEGISGLQLEMSHKITTKTLILTTTAKIKSNYEKNESSYEVISVATEINTDNEEEQENRTAFTGYWIKDGYFYTDAQITAPNDNYSMQRKYEINSISSHLVPDVYSMFDEALESTDFEEIFEMSAKELEDMGAEVYIDNTKSDNTKIKIVYNSDNAKDEDYQFDGYMIFVFNANNDIVAMKCNIDAKIDESLHSLNYTLRNFAGSIKLPKNSENWEMVTF